MSIFSRAALDVQSIINADGEDVTLTAPDATEYAIKGLVFKTDSRVDPETQVEVNEPRTSIMVSLLDLDGAEPTEEWEISTTDVLGNAITGQVMVPVFDRTVATVRFVVEAVT